MAQVFRARHADGTAVAVKVLLHERALDLAYLGVFRHEVRTLASLDHPHVVLTLDHGRIPRELAREDPELLAGSPYLVMEWASGETLSSLEAIPDDWRALRELLDGLLGALGHAHARGVLHRDIKPSNILRCTDDDLRPGYKLADFGIARHHARSRARGPAPQWGTPPYMAPEQVLGLTSEEGPWTDLYSLGCLAFRLACGEPPFVGTIDEIFEQHLGGTFPELCPRFPVPSGFEAWIAALTSRDWRSRLLYAADARRALASLPDLVEGAAVRITSPPPDPTTGSNTVTTVVEGPRRRSNNTPALLTVPPRPRLAPPPIEMPASWRDSATEPMTPATLRDVGLGLFGLKQPPIVGRHAARDLLWALLRESAQGSCRLVLVRGAPGSGKSALSRWLCLEAAERSAAQPLKASHSADSGVQDAIGGALRQGLGCLGLDHDECVERVTKVLEAFEVHDAVWAHRAALAVAPPDDARPPLAPAEQREVFSRLLGEWAARRPIVLWLDDMQWGAGSLLFVMHHLTRRPDSRVLFVATLGAADPDRFAVEHEIISELAAKPQTTELALGPLEPEAMTYLVRRLLGVEPELAVRLERRAAGNPMYAVELIGDWVGRGLLERGPHGFTLRAGAEASMPGSVVEVWQGPVQSTLEAASAEDRVALMGAGVLGNRAEASEWRAVCAELGVPSDPATFESWIDQGLLRSESGGESYRFMHAIVRELLVDEAGKSGELPRLHEACARVLQRRGDEVDDVRLSEHLLRAGRVREALEPLIRGASRLNTALDFRLASSLLRDAEATLADIALPEDDPHWGAVWLARAWNLRGGGMRSLAEVLAERTEIAAAEHNWDAHLSRAKWMRAVARLDHGDLETALRLAEQARELLPEDSPLDRRLAVTRLIGYLLRSLGQPARSIALAEEAMRLAEAAGENGEVGRSLRDVGDAYRASGAYADALAHYERALPLLEQGGLHQHHAITIDRVAAAHLGLGNLDAAEKAARESIAKLEEQGAHDASVFWWYARITYAHMLIARGETKKARKLLLRVATWLREADIGLPRLFLGILELALEATDERWDAYEEKMGQVEAALETGPIVPECATAIDLAYAIVAARSQEREPAMRALRDTTLERIGCRRA